MIATATERPQIQEAEMVQRFARAIAQSGSRALLLDGDNRGLRWRPLGEAARSGQAFAVEVAADVLAVDCDRPDRSEALAALADDLRAEGLAPVLVASGRAGHQHLLARVHDPDRLAGYQARARRLGLDVRRTIRPPLAPHRLGLAVTLLEPRDPAAALAALAAPPAPRALSPRMSRLLRTGDFASQDPAAT